MKKHLISILSAILILALCVPAFAAEGTPEENSSNPVEGSWVLNGVYESKAGVSSLLKKSEHQSYYGSDISVFVFDNDGAAHIRTFEGDDLADVSASWKTTDENVYVLTEENGPEYLFIYDTKEDELHRITSEAPGIDFCYTRAFVGSWQLDKVLKINEGDAYEELTPENAASLYAEKDNIITINPDGTGLVVVKDGNDKTEEKGEWKSDKVDTITFTVNDLADTYSYFSVEDTLTREVKDDAPDAAYPDLHFIYKRVEVEEKETETATTAAAAAGDKAETETTVAGEDELINDGKIFTGFEQPAFDPKTLDQFVLKELSQGGYLCEERDVIYVQEGGGGDHLFGENGTVLMMGRPEQYPEYSNIENENELINDGKIFTGFEQPAFDPGTLAQYVLKELSQGGYWCEERQVIYQQEGGGGDHLYGEDGSVLLMGRPEQYPDASYFDDDDDYVDDEDYGYDDDYGYDYNEDYDYYGEDDE